MSGRHIDASHIEEIAGHMVTLAVDSAPLLLGIDLDGTLSPLVDRAPDARLVPGAHEVLMSLNRISELEVFVVTGRSRRDAYDTFGLPNEIRLIGSHGHERHDGTGPVEDRSTEIDRFEVAVSGMVDGMNGAWVERKPHSVALHVREVDVDATRDLIDSFRHLVPPQGWDVLEGSGVIEAGISPLDKGIAIDELRRDLGARSVCFVGDDVTDERVFRRLGDTDLGIKVGDGPTLARLRLGTPAEVVEALRLVAQQLGDQKSM
jgi:trehalose 6-phosphate phosphatase